MRLALGAFRTSPVNSLYVEANEPSPNLRRKKLSLQFYLKLKSNPNNPSHEKVFEPLYKDEFLEKDKVIPPFSLRCEADFNCLDCDLENTASHRISEVPLWTAKSPTYLYNLASDKKVTTDPMIFKTKFLQIKEQYYTYEEIYTDGSKDGEKFASTAILDGESYQFRLPNNSSIFSAELKAIDLALNHIEQDAYWRYIIFNDSLSAMLIECTNLAPYSDKYFNVGSLKTLFDSVKLESLFQFLKEVNLFKKIYFYLFDI